MKAISKILFTSPDVHVRILKFIGAAGVSGILSGCMLFAQDYGYVLHIENKLPSAIAYCIFNDKDCSNIIQSGSGDSDAYISHGKKLGTEEVYNIFDTKKIKICGEPIDFKRIRSIAPIIKHDEYHFEIIIDKTVSDAFCR